MFTIRDLLSLTCACAFLFFYFSPGSEAQRVKPLHVLLTSDAGEMYAPLPAGLRWFREDAAFRSWLGPHGRVFGGARLGEAGDIEPVAWRVETVDYSQSQLLAAVWTGADDPIIQSRLGGACVLFKQVHHRPPKSIVRREGYWTAPKSSAVIAVTPMLLDSIVVVSLLGLASLPRLLAWRRTKRVRSQPPAEPDGPTQQPGAPDRGVA